MKVNLNINCLNPTTYTIFIYQTAGAIASRKPLNMSTELLSFDDIKEQCIL